jgi:TRAP-type mannitol/chloroaromatic compound transport system permease small subunit
MLPALRRIAEASTWISGAALIFCSIAIAAEVLLRKVFSVSLGGVDEITSYVFAIGVAFALSHTLLSRAHIRIDVVYTRLPRLGRALLDVLAMLSLISMAGLLLWQASATAMTSFELSARSNTPLGVSLWIPQFLWVAGLALFFATNAVLVVAALLVLRRGEYGALSRLAGIRTIDEEIRDET